MHLLTNARAYYFLNFLKQNNMTKIKILLFSCFAFMMAANLQAQCTSANGGPYTNLNTVMPGGIAPCDPNCGTVYTITAFEVWSSESYIFYGLIQGNSYTVDICTGAGANAWAQELVVGPFDGTSSVTSVDGSITNNCSLTFTASTSGDYLIMINTVGTCGGPENGINGGNLSVQCNGVAPCTPPGCGDSVCGAGEDYCSCLADCTTCVGAAPTFITGAQNGGTLATSTVPVAYCESEINTGGVNSSPESVFIPFVAFGGQSCVTDWNVSTNFGTLFNSTDPISAYTAPTPDNILAYVGLTDADITASGGTVTITFVDATTTGGCSFTLAINLASAVDSGGAAWLGTATAQCPSDCILPEATSSIDCSGNITVTITNEGEAVLGTPGGYTWDIDGTPVTMPLGGGTFSGYSLTQSHNINVTGSTNATCDGLVTLAIPVGCELMAGCTDAMTDGGFESGPAGGTWTETVSDATPATYAVPTISGVLPISGANGADLGGFGTATGITLPITATVSQSIAIPTDATTLSFWGIMFGCGGAADVFTVSIGGVTQTVSGAGPQNGGATNCGDGIFYQYDINVSGLAGTTAILEFSIVETGGAAGFTRMFIDNIVLQDCPTTTCPDDYAGGGLGNSQPALTGLVSASGTTDYETPGVISSTQTVDVNTDYDSGDCIDMQANFEVVLGVEFDAFIDGANCNGMGGNQFSGGSNTAAKGTTANRSVNPDTQATSNKMLREMSRADDFSNVKNNLKQLSDLASER